MVTLLPRVQEAEAEAEERRLLLVRLEAAVAVAVEGMHPHQLVRVIRAVAQVRLASLALRSPPARLTRFPLVLRADKL